jgi:hypothetical protein
MPVQAPWSKREHAASQSERLPSYSSNFGAEQQKSSLFDDGMKDDQEDDDLFSMM